MRSVRKPFSPPRTHRVIPASKPSHANAISQNTQARPAVALSETQSFVEPRRFESSGISELLADGAASGGDLNFFIRDIFAGGAEHFQPQGNGLFRFTMPHANSFYNGEFETLGTSAELKRLTVTTDEPQPGEICRFTQSTLYQAGTSFPSQTNMTLLYATGEEAQNETKFLQCKATPEPPPQVSTPSQFPPNMPLQVAMDQPIPARTATAGDIITAVVTRGS